jgi:hypothetical protein
VEISVEDSPPHRPHFSVPEEFRILWFCILEKSLGFRQADLGFCVGFCGKGCCSFAICGKNGKNNPVGSVFTRIRRNPKLAFLAPANSRHFVKSRAKEVANLGNISGRFRHFCHFLTKNDEFFVPKVVYLSA